jgi:hypothetical protein
MLSVHKIILESGDDPLHVGFLFREFVRADQSLFDFLIQMFVPNITELEVLNNLILTDHSS